MFFMKITAETTDVLTDKQLNSNTITKINIVKLPDWHTIVDNWDYWDPIVSTWNPFVGL